MKLKNFLLTESRNTVDRPLLFKAKNETDCIALWRMHYEENPYGKDEAGYGDRDKSYKQLSGYLDSEYRHSFISGIQEISDEDMEVLEQFIKTMYEYGERFYDET